MNEKLKNSSVDNLFNAVLQLKNIEECYNFFEDLCTVHELQALAQRLDVAIMLKKGGTYTEISQKTGASTATISRINRALNYGCDGYALVLKRLEEKSNDNRKITNS